MTPIFIYLFLFHIIEKDGYNMLIKFWLYDNYQYEMIDMNYNEFPF